MSSENEFNDLDLEKLPGIFDDNFKNNEIQNLKEEIITSFPILTEEPIHPNQTEKVFDEEINAQKEQEIFTFKKINNKKEKISGNENNYNKNLKNKINNNRKRIETDKIKEDIISFEELMKKNNSKIKKINKSKDKKDNKKIEKIDLNRKLYQKKKRYEIDKENKEIKTEKIIKYKSNKILKDLPHNKSEISIKTKNIFKPDKQSGKNKNKINEKDKILYNYFKLDNSSKKKSNLILNYKDKNIILT